MSTDQTASGSFFPPRSGHRCVGEVEPQARAVGWLLPQEFLRATSGFYPAISHFEHAITKRTSLTGMMGYENDGQALTLDHFTYVDMQLSLQRSVERRERFIQEQYGR